MKRLRLANPVDSQMKRRSSRLAYKNSCWPLFADIITRRLIALRNRHEIRDASFGQRIHGSPTRIQQTHLIYSLRLVTGASCTVAMYEDRLGIVLSAMNAVIHRNFHGNENRFLHFSISNFECYEWTELITVEATPFTPEL